MTLQISDPLLKEFLVSQGFSLDEVEKMTLEMRVLHDLKIDGDSFDEFMEDLHYKFGVDLRQLDFSKYSPSEGDLLSFGIIDWFRGRRIKKRDEYPAVTLAMLSEALRLKRWPYD